MRDKEFASTSTSVVLNILGILRWASPSTKGGWDVEGMHRGGANYIPYHTFNGMVVWDVKKLGGYPDHHEWAGLETRASEGK